MTPIYDKTHEYKTQVRKEHIDSYGHVNNAVYAQFFEEARWDLIHAGGGSRELVKELGVGPIVVEMKLRFSRELVEGEKITIRSWREGDFGKTYTLFQNILKENGDIACKGEYRMAFLDMAKRKMANIPEEWKHIL